MYIKKREGFECVPLYNRPKAKEWEKLVLISWLYTCVTGVVDNILPLFVSFSARLDTLLKFSLFRFKNPWAGEANRKLKFHRSRCMKRRITFQISRKIKLYKKKKIPTQKETALAKKIHHVLLYYLTWQGNGGLFVGENILLIYFFFDFLLSLFESFYY